MEKISKILLVAESVWSLGSGLFLPIFAIFSERVGGDILDAGIAAAIFMAVLSAFQYPLGGLLDRIREKWFIVAAYALSGLVFCGYIFVENKYQLFALQAVLGVACAVGDTAWDSMFSRHAENGKSGRSWSMYHMYAGFAGAVGIMLGSLVAGVYGFSPIFAAGGMLAFVSAAVTAFGIPFGK